MRFKESLPGDCQTILNEKNTEGKADLFGRKDQVGAGTPPKTNMEPQNEGLEDEFPFKWGEFQVPC